MKRKRAWLAAALLAACAPAEDNAVLLLRIKVPYAEGDRPLAEIQINRDDERFGFEDPTWITPKPHTVDLRKGRELVLAVETKSPEEADVDHLRVRITFCNERGPCQGEADTPELQFLLEHPFYPGELTEWHAAPAGDPSAPLSDSEIPGSQAEVPPHQDYPLLVDRCSIAGCIQLLDADGDGFRPDPELGFCRVKGKELVHFCEEN